MIVTFRPSGFKVDVPDRVLDLAQEFRSEMMDAHELLYLAAALAAYPWDVDAIIVEIGTFVGRTAVFMAKVMQELGRRVPVLSIDPFERAQPDPLNPQGVYAAYVANIQASGVGHVCLPLVAFSRDAAGVVPEKIGVLVVDGAHHYEAARHDLVAYWPKVLPGGLIFIDDYIPEYPGVMRAVEEFKARTGRECAVLHEDYFVIARRRVGPARAWLQRW